MYRGFWAKVDRRGPAECWPWLGASKNAKGYGNARGTTAHRFAFQLAGGKIPKGYEVDHLCRNPACCNPAHLEAVTPQENKRRASLARSARPYVERSGDRWRVVLELGRIDGRRRRLTVRVPTRDTAERVAELARSRIGAGELVDLRSIVEEVDAA